MGDALLKTENAQLPYVPAEILRERAVRARVRLVAAQDAVRAAGVDPVPHDRPHVLLVPDVLEDRRAQPVVEEQSPRGGPGGLATSVGRLPDRPAHVGRECRIGDPEISMVSHSMGTPWQPSAPTTSM
jgi:hypothetical protein